MKRKTKRKIKRIVKLVLLLIFFAFIVALSITNIFVPVIYLSAYVHIKEDKSPLNEMRIRYFDVGYGDCSLIELPDGKTLLIDGGTGSYSNVYNLLNILNKSGIDTIDYLVCTSVKSEHCGSLAQIAKYKTVKTAYIPKVINTYITDEYAAFYKQLLKNGAYIEIAENGKGVYSAEYDYYFAFLSPQISTYYDSEYNIMNNSPTAANINNASAVLWLEYAGRGFMFLSDASAQAQQKVADQFYIENKIQIGSQTFSFSPCAVLKAANHCANGYTQPFLYDLIAPQTAIISVGKNAQSSPAITEISNLQLYVEDKIYRTDVHGTITVTLNPQEFRISKEKK